jgi:hypothetical protein
MGKIIPLSGLLLKTIMPPDTRERGFMSAEVSQGPSGNNIFKESTEISPSPCGTNKKERQYISLEYVRRSNL